jgi:hypothetical protein
MRRRPAKPKALQRVVRKNAHHYRRDALTEALDEIPYHATFISPENEVSEESLECGVKVLFDKDAIDQPNEGWFRAQRYSSESKKLKKGNLWQSRNSKEGYPLEPRKLKKSHLTHSRNLKERDMSVLRKPEERHR